MIIVLVILVLDKQKFTNNKEYFLIKKESLVFGSILYFKVLKFIFYSISRGFRFITSKVRNPGNSS